MATFTQPRAAPLSTPPPTPRNLRVNVETISDHHFEFIDMENTTPRKPILGQQELTPPITPTTPVKAGAHNLLSSPSLARSYISLPQEPLVHSGTFELQQVLGRGAWSTVYLASEVTSKLPRALAIKTPSHKQANAIILQEARILTYLSKVPGEEQYLVPFHGLERTSTSLVMDALPLSLESFARSQLVLAKENISTASRSEPIMGRASFLQHARYLINGLRWLHRNHTVHGDIKPANILLPHTSSLAPLYCDFSSARVLSESSECAALPTDALTLSYASPELLASYRTGGVPTFASDVYALAVTLVALATGEDPYAGVNSHMKLLMAKEGYVLDAVRNGAHALRVKKGGAVERLVAGALEKKAHVRWSADEWSEVVELLMKE